MWIAGPKAQELADSRPCEKVFTHAKSSTPKKRSARSSVLSLKAFHDSKTYIHFVSLRLIS